MALTPHSKKLVAEFLGTFALVLVGAGAVIVEAHTGMSHLGKPDGKVGLSGIAFAHGLTLMGAIYAFGSISGGHFNPAVSFAAWMREKLDNELLTGYLLAQLAGAIAAAACLAGFFPDEVELAGLGTPALAPKITVLKGLLLEGAITYVLVLVILFVTRKENQDTRFAGLAIGATLVALILFAGPLTGAGANPARYLGPAIVAGRLSEGLVYIVGPFLGGALAATTLGFVSDLSEASPERAPPTTQAAAEESEFEPVESDDPRELVRQARELYRTGNGEEAATLLVPLLLRLNELSRDVGDSVRTLLIVIEEEHGKLKLLDKYRSLMRPAAMYRA